MDEYKLDASSLSTFAPHLPRPPSHQGIIPIGSHYNMTRHVLMMEIGAVAGSVFFFFLSTATLLNSSVRISITM